MSRYYGASGGFRQKRQAEEVDPMSSMGNMGDIMLVFACGLMVALVVAWNVDLGKFTQVEVDESNPINPDEQVAEMLYGEGNAFVEKGTVYQDPTTGKYYLVEEGAGTSTSANVTDSASGVDGASDADAEGSAGAGASPDSDSGSGSAGREGA